MMKNGIIFVPSFVDLICKFLKFQQFFSKDTFLFYDISFLDNRTIIFSKHLMQQIRHLLFNLWKTHILKELCFKGI